MKIRRAFTLIELLVVIVIIVVLMAILLPALAKAKEQARMAACGANLHQISIAAAAYSVENEGYVIPVGYADSTGANLEMWPNILVYGGFIPRATKNTLGPTPITRTVFYCPSGLSDKVSTVTPQSSLDPNGSRANRVASQKFDTSIWVDCWYAINGVADQPVGSMAVWPCYRMPLVTGNPDGSPRYLDLKLANLASPSELAFIYDGWGFNAAGQPARINARHAFNTKTNILMFDGHVETYLRSQLPPGNSAPDSDGVTAFSHAVNLNNLYPKPLWRLDQLQ